VLRRPDLTDAALTAAAQLLARLWRPGQGVYHVDDGHGRRLPGLLRDQAETARAVLHVLQYTDDRRFLPAAEDLLEALSTRHVAPDGDLVDRDKSAASRAAPTPPSSTPPSPPRPCCGALFLGRPSLAARPPRAELHAIDFPRRGHHGRLRPRRRACAHPPLHIVVVGDRGDERTTMLFKVSAPTAVRAVQLLDPAATPSRRAPRAAGPRRTCRLHLPGTIARQSTATTTLWAAPWRRTSAGCRPESDTPALQLMSGPRAGTQERRTSNI
jgi:hypothetical protein